MSNAYLDSVQHHPACTWRLHVERAGETAPGQSFWGILNYIWCQEICFGHKVNQKKLPTPNTITVPSRLLTRVSSVRI